MQIAPVRTACRVQRAWSLARVRSTLTQLSERTFRYRSRADIGGDRAGGEGASAALGAPPSPPTPRPRSVAKGGCARLWSICARRPAASPPPSASFGCRMRRATAATDAAPARHPHQVRPRDLTCDSLPTFTRALHDDDSASSRRWADPRVGREARISISLADWARYRTCRLNLRTFSQPWPDPARLVSGDRWPVAPSLQPPSCPSTRRSWCSAPSSPNRRSATMTWRPRWRPSPKRAWSCRTRSATFCPSRTRTWWARDAPPGASSPPSSRRPRAPRGNSRWPRSTERRSKRSFAKSAMMFWWDFRRTCGARGRRPCRPGSPRPLT